MPTINRDNVSIYVETLFALARDARAQGRPEALDFIKGYLVGLVPASALQGFLDDLIPIKPDQSKPPKPNGNGGSSLVLNPVPDKPLSPAGLAVKW